MNFGPFGTEERNEWKTKVKTSQKETNLQQRKTVSGERKKKTKKKTQKSDENKEKESVR